MSDLAPMLTVCAYTLRSTNTGMCEDLLTDAGYDPADHAAAVEAMADAADLAAVDAAYDVMREHGLKPIADQRLRLDSEPHHGHPGDSQDHGNEGDKARGQHEGGRS